MKKERRKEGRNRVWNSNEVLTTFPFVANVELTNRMNERLYVHVETRFTSRTRFSLLVVFLFFFLNINR